MVDGDERDERRSTSAARPPAGDGRCLADTVGPTSATTRAREVDAKDTSERSAVPTASTNELRLSRMVFRTRIAKVLAALIGTPPDSSLRSSVTARASNVELLALPLGRWSMPGADS